MLKVLCPFLPPKCTSLLVCLFLCPSWLPHGPQIRVGCRRGALDQCCTDFPPRCPDIFHQLSCWPECIARMRPKSYRKGILQGRTSLLWGWRSPGPGCPGRLWNLLLWRYSDPAWTWSCAACSGWSCFGRGMDWVTHRGPFQARPFCDSVKVIAQVYNWSPR